MFLGVVCLSACALWLWDSACVVSLEVCFSQTLTYMLLLLSLFKLRTWKLKNYHHPQALTCLLWWWAPPLTFGYFQSVPGNCSITRWEKYWLCVYCLFYDYVNILKSPPIHQLFDPWTLSLWGLWGQRTHFLGNIQ